MISNFRYYLGKLEFFLRKNSRSENDFLSIIRNFHLSVFFLDFCEFNNKDEYENLINLMDSQEKRYNTFKQEMNILARKAIQENVDLLFLKGVILSEDLFDIPETRRSLDMDLLIDFSDLNIMDKILRNNGYYVLNEDTYTNSLVFVNKFKSIREELTHTNVYYKKMLIDEAIFELEVDLHINCCHYLTKFDKNDNRSLINRQRSVLIRDQDFTINTLDTNDTLIHLSAHFLRHFYWEYFRFLRGKNHFELRQDLLFELALFVGKYQKSIKKEILINRAIELNQFEPLFISFVLVNYIFEIGYIEELLPQMYDFYAKSNFENGLSSYFSKGILTCNLEIICRESSHQLSAEITRNLRILLPILNLERDRYISFDIKESYFNINLVPIVNYEILGTNDTFKDSLSINSKLSLLWNDDGILVHFSMSQIKKICWDNINQICFSITHDENDCFFDELINTNPQDKMFSNNCKTIYIKPIGSRFETFTNFCDSLEANEYGHFTSDNEFIEVELKLPWNTFGFSIKPRRIIDILFFIDFICEDEELYVFRVSQENHNNFVYSNYYPWHTEHARVRLI